MPIQDPAVLDEAVRREWSSPRPCKPLYGTHIRELYFSDPISPLSFLCFGRPMISDFGKAFRGTCPFAMNPRLESHHAPEVLLGLRFNEKIDIWALGLMIWEWLEGKELAPEEPQAAEEESPSRIARMISLLGPPPRDILRKIRKMGWCFNRRGRFRFNALITDTSLGAEEKNLEGTEKDQFLAFLRRMLQWRPGDKASASELLKDP